MHHFTFYHLRRSFQSVFVEENLKVLGELLARRNESDLMQDQVQRLIEPIVSSTMADLLVAKFQSRVDFSREEMTFVLHNPITHADEYLDLTIPEQITLSCDSEDSQFFDFIALYYPEMVAIELNEHKIIPMRLVKPALMV